MRYIFFSLKLSEDIIKLRKYLSSKEFSQKEFPQKDFQKILSCSKLPVFDLQRFSAEDQGRTELPSALRRREEREKGNVPRSQEIVSASVLFSVTLALLVSGSYMLASVQSLFKRYINYGFQNPESLIQMEGIQKFFFEASIYTSKILLPLLIVSVLIGIIANVSQFGFIFTAYPLGFRLDRMKPDFKRIFPGRRTMFNLGRVSAQVIVISVVAGVIIADDYLFMLKTVNMGLGRAILIFAYAAVKLLFVAAIVLGIISIADFLFQRYEYLENLKITVSEAKRERRDEEGDPLIRQRQRDRAHELRKQRNMIQDVTDADIIVVNPTHFAVGLKYESEMNQAPVVIAKGTDHLAYLIRNIAKENGIHIEENPPLARALYNDVDIGQEIPETLYRVVSLIFAKLSRFQKEGVTHV